MSFVLTRKGPCPSEFMNTFDEMIFTLQRVQK